MKFRNGFVSNSSSCSFMCPICGEEGFTLSDDGEKYTGCVFCNTRLIKEHLNLERNDGGRD